MEQAVTIVTARIANSTLLLILCSILSPLPSIHSDTYYLCVHYNIEILRNHAYTDFPTEQTDCLANAGQHLAGQWKAELL